MQLLLKTQTEMEELEADDPQVCDDKQTSYPPPNPTLYRFFCPLSYNTKIHTAPPLPWKSEMEELEADDPQVYDLQVDKLPATQPHVVQCTCSPFPITHIHAALPPPPDPQK